MSSRADFKLDGEAPQHYGATSALSFVWDVPTLSWVKSTGSGGGGGAVTIADGADVAQGSKADAAWVAGDGTTISLLKKIASGGGGGSGPVTIIDGGDVAEGTTTDAAWVSGAGTVISLLKKIASPSGGGLTDAQLRATPVPVSGTVTANAGTNLNTSALNLEATQALVKAKTDNLDVALSTRLKPADTLTAVTTVGTITNVVHVDDNTGSLTVDAPVGTPVFARLSDGAAALAGQKVMASSLPVVIASDQTAVPVSGTVTTSPPANASTNVTQWAGTAVDVNSGLKSAGTLRVVLATDQPALTNKLLVTPDSVALPANQSVNVAQFGATNVVTGTGAGGAGIPRVTVSNDSALATVTTVTAVTAITNALPTGANIIGSVNGDVDHDAANTLKQIQVGGHASPVKTTPTAVSATGDRVRGWFDQYGRQIIASRRLPTYRAMYRLALTNAEAGLTFTHVANTEKQYATIYHAASATKLVKIRRAYLWIYNVSVVAGIFTMELRRLSATTAPATGNPAITPLAVNSSDGAAEATCLALPTTAGSEANSNSPLMSARADYGLTAASSTANPLQPMNPVVLWDDTNGPEEDDCLVMRNGVAEGYAIMIRSSAASVTRAMALIEFTEEVP